MAAAGDGGDGKNPATVDGEDGKNNPAAFRCIDAVRYTVALVVTVFIVSVIVNSIKFVIVRSDAPPIVSVVGGFVSTASLPPTPNGGVLALELNVRAENPSDSVRMYYVNITAYLFDSPNTSTSLHPDYDSMVLTKIPDIVVPQQSSVDSFMPVKATRSRNKPEYFDFLYGGGRMSDVTLRLDGNLITEVMYLPDKTRPTNYYCDNLILGGNKDDEAFKGLPDVSCSHEHPSSMTVHIQPMMIQASWPFVFAIFLALF